MTGGPPLVLASASPRRRELLERARIAFRCQPADVDEAVLPGEGPEALVRRLAEVKAARVAAGERPPVRAVLGADTVVAVDGHLLNKPASVDEAAAMVARLAGRWHEVWTGVALVAAGGPTLEVRAIRARVRFRALDDAEVRGYAESGEGLDKAGAYAIQGLGAGLVEAVEGSYTGVVGLPVAETLTMLRRHAVVARWP